MVVGVQFLPFEVLEADVLKVEVRVHVAKTLLSFAILEVGPVNGRSETPSSKLSL